MYILLLRFTENRVLAAQHMPGHNAWLKQGFDDGVFLLAGALQPGLGGAVMAHGITREALQARVATDPFVKDNIVTAEILEITPGKADERLAFMVG